MIKLRYIFAILLILVFSAAFSWAEDSKPSSNDEESVDNSDTVDEATSFAEDFFGEEIPDAITLGQMMQEGVINPVKSKSKRDNPFQPPEEQQSQGTPSGIEPLPPPPFVGPQLETAPEKTLADIVSGIKLKGIMEIVEGKKIAILDFDGIRKSLKVGDEFPGPTTLVVIEIGDDSVILSTKDGADKAWVGFTFANPQQ